MEAPVSEAMTLPKSFEVRYPGSQLTSCEVTLGTADVQRVTDIEKALSTNEFGQVEKEPTFKSMKKWLEKDVTLPFKRFLKKSESDKDAIIGVATSQAEVTTEMIAFKNSGRTTGIEAYTLIYDHESDLVKANPEKQQREISFVTDQPDSERDPESMALAFQQSAMIIWERAAGKTPTEFNGSFTTEQKAEAEKLEIYAHSGTGDNEVKYREALEKAGFTRVIKTKVKKGEIQETYVDEDGDEQFVWQLSLDTVLQKFADLKEKAAA